MGADADGVFDFDYFGFGGDCVVENVGVGVFAAVSVVRIDFKGFLDFFEKTP